MARKCKSRYDRLAFLLGAMPCGLLLSHATASPARQHTLMPARARVPGSRGISLFFSPGFLRPRNTIQNIITDSPFPSNERCDNR